MASCWVSFSPPVLAFSLTRLALALRVGNEADWTFGTFASVAVLGLLYDLTTALLLTLPFGLWLTVLPEHWIRFRVTRLLIGLAIASGILPCCSTPPRNGCSGTSFRPGSTSLRLITWSTPTRSSAISANPTRQAGLGGLGGLALLGTLAVRRR